MPKKTVNFSDITDSNLREFCKTYWSEYSIDDLIDQIKQVEIKNRNTKIPKFTLQFHRFVYTRLMDFPVSDFNFETIITKNFLEDIY